MKKLIVCLLVVSLVLSLGLMSMEVSAQEPGHPDEGGQKNHELRMNIVIFEGSETISSYISKVTFSHWNGETEEVTIVKGLTKVLKSITGEGVTKIDLSEFNNGDWITLNLFPGDEEKFASRIMILDLKSAVYFLGNRSMLGTIVSNGAGNISIAPYSPNPEGEKPENITFHISPHTKFVTVENGEVVVLETSDFSAGTNVLLSGIPKEKPQNPEDKPELISILINKVKELPMPRPHPEALIFEGVSGSEILTTRPHPEGETGEEFRFKFDDETKFGRHKNGERFVISANELEEGDKLVVMITSKQFDGSWEYYAMSVDIVDEFPPPPKMNTERIFGKFLAFEENFIFFMPTSRDKEKHEKMKLPMAKECRFMRFSKDEEPVEIGRDEISEGNLIQMKIVEIPREDDRSGWVVVEITVVDRVSD